MVTMRNEVVGYAGLAEEMTHETAIWPPAVFEYGWYVVLFYAFLGQAWDVVIPAVNGALLMLLAAACVLTVGVQAPHQYKPVAFALLTGMSVIGVHFFFHSEEALLSSIFIYAGWLSHVIIVQSLTGRRGFLKRFAFVAFAIGLACLPYIQLDSGAGLVRARATGTGISNGNVLGMWFGFCTVYFIFLGLQSRDHTFRALYWITALGCLYVVALTVSRGPLLGIVLACVVGLRSSLKRQFTPVLSLVLLVCLAYASGVFQETIDYYMARGTVETGRGKVWPLVLQRILDSPWTGVGMESLYTMTGSQTAITPHNALLYLCLAAGIIPMVCLVGYLARAAIGSLYIMRNVYGGETALLPPLVAFALLESMILDTPFMSPWSVVIFGLAARAPYTHFPKDR